jgi:ectoine hydroxylase-related dioxygenase (phytanoyl-CoA dioxygenase family)
MTSNKHLYTPAKSQADFITTPSNLKSTLDKYGVAIIPNVIDATEIAQMKQGFWTMLNQLSSACPVPITEKNKASWSTYYAFNPIRGQLLQNWGVGQSQVLWNLRQNPKIVDIFAQLWNVSPEELLVSFDGCSFALPHETTKKGSYTGKDMYHIDQAPSVPQFNCVQSWINAFDTREGDATLSVFEGSHTYLGEFAEKFGKANVTSDWNVLKSEELDWYKSRGCVVRDITCPAGSLVFWDSRSIHYGKAALPGRDTQNFRAVAYLCYTPRSLASEEALANKRDAFTKQRSTSHYPHAPKLFSDKPRFYDRKVISKPVRLPPPKLNKLGRKLAGFED